MFNRKNSVFVGLLKTWWLRFFLFFFVACSFDCMDIFHGTCRIVFAPPRLLVAEDCDDSSGRWHLHAEVCLIDDCRELDDGVAAEDGIVWLSDVYNIEGYELCSLGVAFSKGHIQLHFAEGFDLLPPEADEWVLRLL